VKRERRDERCEKQEDYIKDHVKFLKVYYMCVRCIIENILDILDLYHFYVLRKN